MCTGSFKRFTQRMDEEWTPTLGTTPSLLPQAPSRRRTTSASQSGRRGLVATPLPFPPPYLFLLEALLAASLCDWASPHRRRDTIGRNPRLSSGGKPRLAEVLRGVGFAKLRLGGCDPWGPLASGGGSRFWVLAVGRRGASPGPQGSGGRSRSEA